MAKTRSRAMAKKKSPPRSRRRTKGASSTPPVLNVLTRVIIKKTGVDKPEKLVSFEGGPVAWLIHNISGIDHTITIDPKKFSPSNPLAETDLLSVRVPDQDKGVLIGTVRDDANETAYTYDIELLNARTNVARHIDPDLDVVDPRPLI